MTEVELSTLVPIGKYSTNTVTKQKLEPQFAHLAIFTLRKYPAPRTFCLIIEAGLTFFKVFEPPLTSR